MCCHRSHRYNIISIIFIDVQGKGIAQLNFVAASLQLVELCWDMWVINMAVKKHSKYPFF